MSDDEAAVKQIEMLWDEAWNRHDSEALASLLSEDANFVTVAGVWTKDRAEFRRLMERLHQMQFKDSARGTRIVRKQGDHWETVATQYTNVVASGR